MDVGLLGQFGIMASFGLSALGSAVGVGVVGTTTIGAWKKCFVQNKPVPFILVAFAGVPLSNVIYGFILMNTLASSEILNNYQLLFLGLFGGMGIGVTAYTQARCCAYASEAFAETGQGFGNYMMVIGICETVALFVMVLSILFA